MCDTVASLDARHSRSASGVDVVEQRYQAVLQVLDGIPATHRLPDGGTTRIVSRDNSLLPAYPAA
jgi:hypothetical protein